MKFTFIIVLIMDKRGICCYCLCLFTDSNINYKKRKCNSFWHCCLRMLRFSIFASLRCLKASSGSGRTGGRGAAAWRCHSQGFCWTACEEPREVLWGVLRARLWYTWLNLHRVWTCRLPRSFYAPARTNFHGLDCDRLSEFRSLCSARARRPPVLRPH